MVDLSRLMQDAAILEVIDKSADEASNLSAQNSYQAMRIEELEAECEGLKVDAGRYRFLRDRQDMAVHVAVLTKNGGYCPKGSECDAAIDAAIAARKP